MAHYEIKIRSSEDHHSTVWEGDRPDDIAALNSALEICRNQQIEIWDGKRQIGTISLAGTPRLNL